MAKQASASPPNTDALKALSTLAFDSTETLVRVQVEAAKHFLELGVDRLNAAVEVKTPEQLQTFWLDNGELTRTVLEGCTADVWKVVEAGTAYITDAQKMVTAQANSVWSRAA